MISIWAFRLANVLGRWTVLGAPSQQSQAWEIIAEFDSHEHAKDELYWILQHGYESVWE